MSGKRMHPGIISKVLVLTSLSFAFWGCVQQPQPTPRATALQTLTPPAKAGTKAAPPKASPKVTPAKAAPSKAAPAAAPKKEAPAPVVKAAPAPPVSTKLQDTDCIKCHSSEPAKINQNGGKHKTEIGCMDCHLEHLPLGTKTIPQCSMCHDPKSLGHFQLANCLGCHRNPHTPLDITVEDVPAVSVACKSCHSDKGEEFAKFPSKHTVKNCTFCHPAKHKQIKKCQECHKPHSGFMVYEDCLRCHKPHSPLNIVYADDTPSKYCGSCHDEIFQVLSKSKAKHATFTCAFCHKTKHPTVPNCNGCHKEPHDNAMMGSFNSDCLKCHKNPHDLVF